jgi:hypothetical protein
MIQKDTPLVTLACLKRLKLAERAACISEIRTLSMLVELHFVRLDEEINGFLRTYLIFV